MDLKELEQIISLFDNSKLSELKIEGNDVTLLLKRDGGSHGAGHDVRHVHASAPAPQPMQLSSEQPNQEWHMKSHGKVDDHLKTIESPMVGTFYRASSPTSVPYSSEGDLVQKGQTLCIIEAMKLMNEIESDISGKIVKILVENGQPVEYGQPLFLIDPS